MSCVCSIRYAAPPVGNLRWQAPRPPPANRSVVTPATQQPPICPQTGGYGLPDVYGFTSGYGDEDCLYLNVYASPNATNLPVMVWIREFIIPTSALLIGAHLD
jgi:carboxylesterase type B